LQTARSTLDHARTGFAAASILALAACASPITEARIERAIAPTFANLVHLQISSIGLPSLPTSSIAVSAVCRPSARGVQAGAGEWACTLNWHGPNQALLRDVYDVSVTPDGCYTAKAEGSEARLGGPTLVGADGKTVRNLLYVFEGCFNTM
jgi:hypothetical protein